MLKRILRWGIALLSVALLAGAAYSRVCGVAIKNADGRMIGYSALSQEWLLLQYPTVAPSRDGPYVFRGAASRNALRLDRQHANNAITLTKTPIEDRVDVTVDNAAGTVFSVALRADYPRQAVSWPMPRKLLVASDLEGEFEAFTDLLRANGVIDAELRWIFAQGHLVLIGDMVDRGSNVLPVLWLIYKLEAEAKAAGGALHYVLGNHEQMLLLGRTDSAARKYIGTIRATGLTQRELWSEHSELGLWLRSKPVLLKVGDILFMHGGVSPEVLASKLDLMQIDQLAARYFTDAPRQVDNTAAVDTLFASTGLLWYRGLARDTGRYAKASSDHVDQVLAQFDVKRIAIGHSLVQHIGHDYGGRVLRIDVAHAQGRREALLFEGDGVQVVDARGQRSGLAAAQELID